MSIFAYHCTNVNPKSIIKHGFKNNKRFGFTEDNQFESLYELYLPQYPCFISRIDVPVWSSLSKYCIKLDITNLELFPDFGHLVNFGAYYDDPDDNGDILFWWEQKQIDLSNSELSKAPKLKEYVKKHDGYLHSEDFTGEMSLDMIGTACIDGSLITSNIIVDIKQKVSENENLYDRPYSLKLIKKHYSPEIYSELSKCPIHRWRAITGIELIHKEPSLKELLRIWKNWNLMSDELKLISDEKSLELFGKTNLEHYQELLSDIKNNK